MDTNAGREAVEELRPSGRFRSGNAWRERRSHIERACGENENNPQISQMTQI